MPRLASRVAGLSGEGALAVFARAGELERAGRSIIHLELGEPDFHPAPPVLEAAKRALDAGRDRYCPPAGAPELRQAVAEYLRRTRAVDAKPEQVLVAPGCKIALFLVLLALVEPGDGVLYPDPGFPIYASLTRGLGGVPQPFPLEERLGFQPDLGALETKLTPRTRLLMLNSPGNPTGSVYDGERLEGLARLAVKHDLQVVSDEIYARVVYGGGYRSIASLPGMAERTTIVDGFSKSFAMTGWRLGYAVASAPLHAALEMLVMNSYTCVNEFVQHAAIEALRDSTGAVERMVKEFGRRRELFVAALNRIPGFRCGAPAGAFYAWVNVEGTGRGEQEVSEILLEEAGVAAIPGTAFGAGGAGFLRFSFASSSDQLEEAAGRIAAISDRWASAAATTGKPSAAGRSGSGR